MFINKEEVLKKKVLPGKSFEVPEVFVFIYEPNRKKRIWRMIFVYSFIIDLFVTVRVCEVSNKCIAPHKAQC